MQSTPQVTVFKFDKATVRMHGTPDRKNLEEAAIAFLKEIEKQKQKEANK